jgi:putative ABC transport system permease protein
VGVAAPDPLRPGDRILLPLVPFTEDRRGQADLDVYARLRSNVSIARADAEMTAIADTLGREHPEAHAGWSVAIRPFADAVVGTATPRVLYLLFASVGLLLLIACANLAGLLLVRGLGRTQEIAIRAALGGGRGRIVRQLITETLFLAVAGGALGVALSYSGMRGLRALLPPDLPRLAEMGVDPWVLGFALAVSAATGLLAGLPPARHMARLDVARGLGDGSRSVSAGGGAARGALVVGQIALSMVLLAAAGLTVRTLAHLQRVDLGFSPERILTMQVAPRSNPETVMASLLDEVRAIPEVISAGAVSGAPMSDLNLSLHVFPVGPARLAPPESLQADWRIVSDGYFAAMETPVLAGRDVTPRDDETGPKVIVVNETLARLMWGDGNPVGRQLDLGGGGGEPATVVGLVADMRHHDPAVAPTPAYYVPAARGVWGAMTLVVRTAMASDQTAARVRAAVARLDPALPVFDVRSLGSFVRARTAPQRLTALTLVAFGTLAVVLAGLGLYGLLAYSARQRRREHAIRLAFGATPADLRRAALLDGGRLVLAGLTLGLVATAAVTRVMQSLLAGISPTDPAALLGAAAVLTIVASLACWLPARRAARVDPAGALRSS